MDRQQIERFERGGQDLREAVTGLSRETLTARPGPGIWSILELVIHVVDSDAIVIDRMKRIITEDVPQLLNADEGAYVTRLHSHDQSLDDAIVLFEVGRRQLARVLRLLPDEAFDRTGNHDVTGTVTLGGLVAAYSDHLDHHMKFLHAKLATLGKQG